MSSTSEPADTPRFVVARAVGLWVVVVVALGFGIVATVIKATALFG